MPKIIENLKTRLLDEAKRQISERGYEAMTVRSVANALGVAVGTVYNYFPSKDMLVASFMLEDWLECIKRLDSESREDARGYLFAVYTALMEFSQKYRGIFSDKAAIKVYFSESRVRHEILRCQIAELILPICHGDGFESEFVAESLLTWGAAGKSFDEIYSIIEKIIK